ncbi:MAG: DUF6288 domain-containing protein [Phycisphaerae bacterium]
MKRHPRTYPIALALAACFLCTAAAAQGRKPKGPEITTVTWSPHGAYKGWQVNLGPTGATGWVNGSRIHVVRVDSGSPADGVLEIGDVILGANEAAFPEGDDCRLALGKAIGESEAGGKKGLALTVLRGDEEISVNVRLRKLGAYGPTWPFECSKSRKILAEACEFLARQQYPDGHIEGELGMPTAWAGLLLLASGDVKYLANARLAAHWFVDQRFATEKISLNNWPRSYAGIFLAEYYLATGDYAVIPELKALCGAIADGQMACGSWGHNSPWDGYGAVNQVGLTCLMALVLAKECGIRVDEVALKKSVVFFRNYAGKGWIPYGDHVPWRGNSGNGKNAIAAVIFSLLRGEGETVRAFSTPVAAAYRYREEGHTGSFFSIMWGPIAAELAGRETFHPFMDYQKGYYDLCRTWRGGIANLPNAENLSGRTPGHYTFNGPIYTTGGLALLYAMPLRKLRILGAERGVFGQKLPAGLAKARTLFIDKKWQQFLEAFAPYRKKRGVPAGERELAAQLGKAFERQKTSVALSLEAFQRSIDGRDVYRASEALRSLEKLLGKDDPLLADARETMAENERWVETGKEYSEAWTKLKDFAWQYWHYYGVRAAAVLEDVGTVHPARWDALVPTSEHVAQTWKVHQWGDAKAESPKADPAWEKLKGWQTAEFDDSKWAEGPGPVGDRDGIRWQGRHLLLRKTFTLKRSPRAKLRLRLMSSRDCVTAVYLNGVKVAEVVRGPQRSKYGEIPLADAASKLLKKGPNVLAVHCRKGGRGGDLDVGLQAASDLSR